MSASKLVKPAVEYKDSFLDAVEEFQAEGRYQFLDRENLEEAFEKFVADLNEGRRHLHKPYREWAEPVPETILWLVKEDRYIGTFNIRHRLNWHLEKWGGDVSFVIRPSMRGKGFGKKILQKGMPMVCYLGIDRALITIDPKDKSSRRIIEFVGGEFEDETPETDKFPARARYWLKCN